MKSRISKKKPIDQIKFDPHNKKLKKALTTFTKRRVRDFDKYSALVENGPELLRVAKLALKYIEMPWVRNKLSEAINRANWNQK